MLFKMQKPEKKTNASVGQLSPWDASSHLAISKLFCANWGFLFWPAEIDAGRLLLLEMLARYPFRNAILLLCSIALFKALTRLRNILPCQLLTGQQLEAWSTRMPRETSATLAQPARVQDTLARPNLRYMWLSSWHKYKARNSLLH